VTSRPHGGLDEEIGPHPRDLRPTSSRVRVHERLGRRRV
jgi:hypothetical protein